MASTTIDGGESRERIVVAFHNADAHVHRATLPDSAFGALNTRSVSGYPARVPTPSTDAAPHGPAHSKPAHEDVGDAVSVADWDRLAALDEFKALLAAKRRFIVPAAVFFILYYFALPVLVGYAPRLMAAKVFGVVNVAYLFALSQFFVAWAVAALYVRAAGRFDAMARRIVDGFKAGAKR